MTKRNEIKSGYGGKINVYLPSGYPDKIAQLMNILKAKGVDIEDPNRPGQPSRSRLIQWLIDAELERQL